jgi:phenylpropionate dioxygenase-like ring-hydroxylating dioxygenase large terminal subunit
MFLTTSHIPQLLPKEAYCSQEQFDREIKQLFMPAWHCVGTTRQFRKEGDYITRTLLGRPLIICLMEGELRAFLNVCAHRLAELTSKPRGCDPTLRCQYHGWEYDAQGHTRKIPDAANFRPLSRDMAALKRYRIATIGQLVFVSLSDDSPSLTEFLGVNAGLTEGLFPSSSIYFADNITSDINWKVAAENGLESYHINCVHRKTLKHYPSEDDCRHDISDKWTLFEAPGAPPSFFLSMMEYLHRRIGFESTGRYGHLHVYPNLFYAWDDNVGSIQSFFPVSPNRVEMQFYSFVRQGKSTPISNSILKVLGPLACLFWRSVVLEDLRTLPAVQRGIEAVDTPVGGLLSRREERCSHFQAYIARETNVPTMHDLPDFPTIDGNCPAEATGCRTRSK